MVAKCLSARTSTVQRVLEAMMLFIELEQAEKVLEAMLVGLSNKNPKVVVVTLELLYNAIHMFGHRVVAPQPIIKALPALFESKDGKAREKVKEIVVELARWMGPDAVRTLLFDKMRDAMRDDINRAMEVVEMARQPERLTRKQQAKAADMRDLGPAVVGGAASATNDVAMEDAPPPEADPYDFAEPKKVLNELKTENFWSKLEEKKWTERRDALLLLKGLADTPRIASGDFGDLMRELRKLISKDSNVVVVAESINCCGLLAKGLRKEYGHWAKNLAAPLLEKLKEKNTNVGIAVTTALTYMHKYCFNLLDVQEDLVEAMGHANPKVKEDTYKWLTTAITQEPKANMKQLVAPLMGAAAKGAEEAQPALREAAMSFMAAFTVRFGNTAILDKFGAKMDETRKKKLQAREDYLIDMVAEAMGGGGGGGAASAGGPAAAPAAATPASPAPRSSAPTINLKSRLAPTSRPTTAAKASATTFGATAASSGSSAAAGGGGAKKAAGGGDGGEDEATLSGGTLSRDQAVAALTDLFGEATVTQLQDEQWKVRLDAIERVVARAGEPSVAASSGSMLVQAVSHVPGWGEKNFQVMAKQFEMLRAVAANCPSFSKRDAFTCIGGLIDKVADLKLKQPSFDTLTSVAEAVGPQFVMTQMHKKAAAHKNPKVQSETINWIARAITEFGMAGLDVRALLEWSKEDLGSANAGVRNAAIQLLGVMYRFLGPALGDMIRADVKPALMTAIDGEFAKNADLPKPEPTRFSRAAPPARAGAGGGKGAGKGGAGGGGGGGAASSSAAGGFDADDLLPRTDISGLITSELVTQLSNSNWKERKAGLDAIETILTQAGNRIQPQVRSAVTEMLDAWVSVAGASCVMPDLMEFYVSAKITADGKAETLKWLAALTAGGKAGECVPDALRAGALGTLDKAVEVRDAANKLITALIEVIGVGELGAAAQSLDNSSRKAALEAISKVTGAPVPVASAGHAAAPASRPATATSTDFKKHCEAADMVTKALPTMYDEVIAVVDLLFRWCTLRILESNTASLVKVLELLKLLLEMMIEHGYRVSEYEAKLILPAVVEKSGHNQDKLKAEHRELLKRFALVHSPIKVATYIKDGLESKNSKTRVVCLDEIAAMVERSGPTVYRAPLAASTSGRAAGGGSDSVMATVARLVAERDTAVRAACLGVMEKLYEIEGIGLWEYLGRLTDQQKSLIEERLKHTGARLARMGLQPGYKAADFGVVQDDPMVVSPAPDKGTPRRPASPGEDEEATMRNWVVIHDRLQGSDTEAAVQAMKLLCYTYNDIDKHSPYVVAMLTDPRNVDELVILLSHRVEQSMSDAAASTMCLPGGPVYNARACKYSANSLMNLCSAKSLTVGLGDHTLRQMLNVLLACMIDGRMRQVADGDGLLKAINMLIMRLLEHANRPGVFGALIHLLREPNPRIYQMVHPSTAPPDGGAAEMLLRWNDMVVKCLIKMTKQLASIIPTINVGEVLVHIHHYMQNLGAEEVRRRSAVEDKPLRMIKTVLHELCKHRGHEIYRDVQAMPGVTEAEEDMVMLPYIKLNLDTQHTGMRPLQPAGFSGAAAMPRAPIAPTTTSDEQEARNTLAAIFKRIGDKAQSQQALVDLHHFIEANPGIDVLNQMLAQVSPYFKTYLQRGLAKVRLQTQHAAAMAAAAAAASTEQRPLSPAPTARAADNGGGGSAGRTSGSSWGTPDADSNAGAGGPITVADKLAAAEAQPRSPMSPGRLRGVGNLDELRNRMNSLSTNLHDLPVRSSTAVVAPGAGQQGLQDLQERMKKIANIGGSSASGV
ncbi:TOG1 protein [Gonium pectorale]|uniref:TOG1 protein n=1 Tax=Gonium pectorale TaxID=33097 RepID=A0A150GB35_GONPE|nr:TOG1 protein [Gonium pectorale]|eukprot:KXZ46795.1 TOG1 protein [Gonium pectorale]